LNVHVEADEGKKAKRDEMIAEGKLTAEAFDAAAAKSSRAFYEALSGSVAACRTEFEAFEKVVDEKFQKNAPRLAEVRKAIEECEQFVTFRLEEKKRGDPAPAGAAPPAVAEETGGQYEAGEARAAAGFPRAATPRGSAAEEDLWREALSVLRSSGVKEALGALNEASYSAPSVRECNRVRLLMGKLCLEAGRPDLCLPIIEDLHVLIQELHLEKWESPTWIAEVLDTLYRCLTAGEPSEEDAGRARALFRQMCTTDVTRAMNYKGQ